ncbi:MAG: D-alanyl-D-alanine carboxypeptidase/D-alanyl-D-alanine-endopeptidase [Pseudomonadota bacterium]
MRVLRYTLLMVFWFAIPGTKGVFAALPPQVTQALARADISEESVAVVVRPVAELTPTLFHRADVAMSPASVMKLLTTYTALQILGPAYTWKTEAFSDGVVDQGSLRGNLYIKGYGDPKLTVEQLWLFLKRIRAAGVKVIAGDVILDTSYFAAVVREPSDFDGQPLRAYNANPSALLINYNAININLSVDTSQQRVKTWMEPGFAALKLVNHVTLDPGPCGDWRNQLNLKIDGSGNARKLQLSGKFSIHCEEKNYAASFFTPTDFAGDLILDLWQEMGGKLRGRVHVGETPQDATMLARLESPPLSTVITDVNKWSNNVMARQLYLTLGAKYAAAPATSDKSFGVVNQWLLSKNLNFPELVLENGSGLSRSERISAGHLADLLIDAWKSPVMPQFIASLPIAAIDGTMKNRLKENGIAGRAYIKTGSLEGVKTLGGYVLDKNGRWMTVVSLINHPQAGKAREAEDALLAWVYEGGH